jgi:valyl-tRNA synthetase
MNLPKTYNPAQYEEDIYRRWEESGAFQPGDGAETFYIPLPPPNATGVLHVGHSIGAAVQDAFTRYARMNGKAALWLPGTDHAAIATESVVIKKLIEERGIVNPREQLGREKLLEEIQSFVESSRDQIRNQFRAMGSSVDWSRERYTMEPEMNRVVNDVFVNMFNDGLIYRGNRIVNWDPNLQTTVSDDEVERREETTNFYTLQYGPFQIGTARPETKFGDKYVVVHPDDERYKQFQHGQTFELEWLNGPITGTVIKDEAADPEFGTGAMTITPWHDATDFEIAERHNLDKQQIIDETGKLLPVAKEFAGMRIEEARPQIVQKLSDMGLLLETNSDYVHNLSLNERGKGIIEPQIMNQWWVDVNKEVVKWNDKLMSLKQVMKAVVAEKEIALLPERMDKTYYNWIDNLHDWCISRQIWWGHRIPVWYKGGETHVSVSGPDDPENWRQDEDTLDTWFSSGLWTFATLLDKDLARNPDVSLQELLEKSPDYQRFHPATLLETGYDIIFFWVARMILMTTYATGQVPFKTVYFHGLVRSRDGKKMSKSNPKGTIDPIEMIDKFGADALRLSMLIGQTPGNDSRLYEEKIAGYRNFCNKLWNVGRYIASKAEREDYQAAATAQTSADHWILHKLAAATELITASFENHRLSDAGAELYRFLWDDLADWYVETSKIQPNSPLLIAVFRQVLQLAHPLAPFVTETLWGYLNQAQADRLLISSQWPVAPVNFDRQAANGFEQIINIVSEIRNLRSELQLEDNTLYHKGSPFLDEYKNVVIGMTSVSDVVEVRDGHGLHLVSTDINCWLDVATGVTKQYLFGLITKKSALSKQHENIANRLENEKYIEKAPPQLVEESRAQLADLAIQVERLSKQIESIEGSLIKIEE